MDELIRTHSWVAGMMHVDPEDLLTVAEVRAVECEDCGGRWPLDLTCEQMTRGCGTCGSDTDECADGCLYEDMGD